jgi:hypothetical protein
MAACAEHVIAGRERAPYSAGLMERGAAEALFFRPRHLLGIEGLSPAVINQFLDLADGYVELNRQAEKQRALLLGRTMINCFFDSSTRTRTSFELAGKRLGGDFINMSVPARSMVKGETLIDTAMILYGMHLDVLVVRHPESGAVHVLSEKVDLYRAEPVAGSAGSRPAGGLARPSLGRADRPQSRRSLSRHGRRRATYRPHVGAGRKADRAQRTLAPSTSIWWRGHYFVTLVTLKFN